MNYFQIFDELFEKEGGKWEQLYLSEQQFNEENYINARETGMSIIRHIGSAAHHKSTLKNT